MLHKHSDISISIILKQNGEPIHVAVRKSLKAKHLQIRIKRRKGDEVIELVVPKRITNNEAYSFAQKHELWIRKKIAQNSKVLSPISSQKDSVQLFGEVYKIIHKLNTTKQQSLISLEKTEIIISAKEGCHSLALKSYMKTRLLEEVTRLANIITKEYHLYYAKISIRDTNTRWGSCSSRKNLSFSLRLASAPLDIIKYVVVHEMCHLKEMNHSKNFWALVGMIYPDYKNAKLYLKNHGQKII